MSTYCLQPDLSTSHLSSFQLQLSISKKQTLILQLRTSKKQLFSPTLSPPPFFSQFHFDFPPSSRPLPLHILLRASVTIIKHPQVQVFFPLPLPSPVLFSLSLFTLSSYLSPVFLSPFPLSSSTHPFFFPSLLLTPPSSFHPPSLTLLRACVSIKHPLFAVQLPSPTSMSAFGTLCRLIPNNHITHVVTPALSTGTKMYNVQ